MERDLVTVTEGSSRPTCRELGGAGFVGIAAGECRLRPICAAAMNLALVAATGELEINHLLG